MREKKIPKEETIDRYNTGGQRKKLEGERIKNY
jgi:hypothetical protein